jgi:hypothetical protein
MTPWSFDMKFPLGTQFTFGSLTFAIGEDGDLKMLPPGPAPKHPTPAPSSTSSGACSGLDPFAGLYIYTAKLVRGILIMTSTLWPFIEASSSSSSASSPDRDSSDNYPQIGASTCKNSVEGGRLILMVAPNGDRSYNSSSGYLAIRGSEASDAQTPIVGLVQNLNLNFNAVRVQAIMETIQRTAPNGSPLAFLAQQGAKAVNLVVAEKSVGVPRGEPSTGRNNRVGHARSEATSSARPNQHLSEHDARRRITQNRNAREYGRNQNDLCNVIEDRRRIRDRTPSPPPRFLARDVTPTGRSVFRDLAGPLREVRWPAKFKAGHIDRYDGSSNPEEFIQVYQTVIKAIGGDDRVKANVLPTALSGEARSWLINLSEGYIHSWDQLCAIFIGNIQGTYEHPFTTETLKTIKQKHDQSLHDYVKHFCNARNSIPHIQDNEIINVFRDGVSDLKTVEEIEMKKPKTVADLLTVADACIEASEARASLLESQGKGP